MSRLRSAAGPVVILLGTLALFFGGKRLLFDHPGGYVVEARFADAAGLRKNSAVKIGGVPGGRVMAVDLADDDTAVVKLRLDEGAAPIGAGARAASRPVNLLGEKFVDLSAGDRSRALPSGSTIPVSRTTAAVELDDVLNVLTPDVRARLRILTNEAGIALAGRGADFNGLLERFPAGLDELRRTVADLGADTRTLERAITEGRDVIAAVDGRRDDLGLLVESAAGALQATADRRAELGATVGRAPATLTTLRDTVEELGDTAESLTPAARRLRATAPALRDTLERLPAFAADASETLRTATAVAPTLSRLGRGGTGPVQRLDPAARALARFAAQLGPVSTTLDKSIADALGFVHGYARAQQQRDGLGHTLRLREIVGLDALQAIVDRYVAPPVRKQTPATKRPAPAPAKPLLPALTPTPASPAQTPSPVKVPLVPQVQAALDDATGQVQDLLDFLLGP